MDLSLNRIRSILKLYNNPQDKFPTIHVAGTNGKGSVCSIIESILILASSNGRNFKVGKFSSPHFLTENDSIRINQESIPRSTYDALKQSLNDSGNRNQIKLTNFELTTAIMFIYFCNEKVDIAVIEVGLGGLNDATNVIQKPLLCLFTSISKDHEAILGNTEKEIALQKSGILKKETIAIIGVQQYKECEEVLIEECNRFGVKYTISGKAHYIDEMEKGWPPKPRKVKYTTRAENTYELELPLKGDFQLQNLAIVLESLEFLFDRDKFGITTEVIKKGVASVHWPGRLQTIKNERNLKLIADGAHNPAAARELNIYLVKLIELNQISHIHWIIASTEGKDVSSIYKNLFQDLDLTTGSIHVVKFTIPEAMQWIQPAKTKVLQDRLKKISHLDIFCSENISLAFEDIYKQYPEIDKLENHLIVVTGSLYLVADLFRMLNIVP